MASVGQAVAGASGTLPAGIMTPALAKQGRGAVCVAARGHVGGSDVQPVVQSGRAARRTQRIPESRRARQSTDPF